MTTSVVRQAVHQPCHHNLEEMCRMTPGQWEQRDQARGDATNVATPADTNVKLKKSDGVSKPVHQEIHQSMIRSLLYAAMATLKQ